MRNYDSIHLSLYRILAEELPDARYSEVVRLATRLGEAAVEKMPKQGDFWLNEDDGRLYVNMGWKDVLLQEQAQ